MHFRLHGNNLQIVKTVVDPATGKSVSRPVGSANVSSGEISDRLSAALTSAEMDEVRAWITRHQDLTERRWELDFQTIAVTLTELADWVRNAEPEQIEPYVVEIEQGWRRLRSAMARKLPRDNEAT